MPFGFLFFSFHFYICLNFIVSNLTTCPQCYGQIC
nr:MAG TPA: hypothetical protein [Caudoviricetes sp.]